MTRQRSESVDVTARAGHDVESVSGKRSDPRDVRPERVAVVDRNSIPPSLHDAMPPASQQKRGIVRIPRFAAITWLCSPVPRREAQVPDAIWLHKPSCAIPGLGETLLGDIILAKPSRGGRLK